MKTNRLLVAVLVLQGIIIAGQWLEGPKMLPTAQAEPFNAGADRQAMLDEFKSMNGKLDQIVSTLNSGNLQVKVVNSDERKDNGRAR